jgi:hypothetical protein
MSCVSSGLESAGIFSISKVTHMIGILEGLMVGSLMVLSSEQYQRIFLEGHDLRESQCIRNV